MKGSCLNLMILLPSAVLMVFLLDSSRNVWPGIGMLAIPPIARSTVSVRPSWPKPDRGQSLPNTLNVHLPER